MLKKIQELNTRQKNWTYKQQKKFTKGQHIIFSLIGILIVTLASLYLFFIPEEQADNLVLEYLLVSNPAVFLLLFSLTAIRDNRYKLDKEK